MIESEQIPQLVALLTERNVKLHHACQLADFRSYLQLGGIPSRALLEGSGAAFTAFNTDGVDKANQVWTKVFVNFEDFGQSFARGHGAVPTPYGPICLWIAPRALLNADDVAICLRSAGAADFNRDQEALEIEDVPRIFACEYEIGERSNSWIKRSADLAAEFGLAKGGGVEVSISFPDQRLPLSDVVFAVVDPYMIRGTRLVDIATKGRAEAGHIFKVGERLAEPERALMYEEIKGYISQGVDSAYELASSPTASAPLKAWAAQIITKKLDYQFGRYAKYLRSGTLEVKL